MRRKGRDFHNDIIITNNNLILKDKIIKDIEIYNYLGALISTYEINQNIVNINELINQKGVYFIVIRDTENKYYFTKHSIEN